jgi:hypothetical protein
MTLKKLGLAGAALAACLASTTARADEAGVKVGVLSCNVESGWGVVFGSTRDVHCAYAPASGAVERYVGHISKYGVDIGYTQGGVIVWAVFAPTSNVAGHSLAGTYAGGTASATVGVGAGVHALIGGFKNSFSLQPVSIEGNSGLNIAAGIGNLTLTAAHP